jgi:hypothetical protein
VKIASVAKMKTHVNEYMNMCKDYPVAVIRNGKPVAVLIGVQDEDEIERLLMAYSPDLPAILEKSRRQIREGRGIAHEEFWTDIEAPSRLKAPTERKTLRHP